MEIENEIKEMNIVDSYDNRQGSLEPRCAYDKDTPLITGKGYITQLSNRHGITDLKTNSKRLKKSFSNTMLRDPKKLHQKSKFPYHRLSYLERYSKVKELQVKIVRNQDKHISLQNQIMQKILNTSIHIKSKKKESVKFSALIKHKSEADILQNFSTKTSGIR
jgi:hypothetical protein